MARRTWWMSSPRGHVELVLAGDLRTDDVVHPRESMARHWLDGWVADALQRLSLANLRDTLDGPTPLPVAWSEAERRALRERILRALNSHEVRMLAERDIPLPASVPAPDPFDIPLITVPEEQHWIEVQLFDPDGVAMSTRRFSIEDPSGGPHAGSLDADGKTHVEPIDPGVCRVQFPGLEPQHWGIRQVPH